MEEKEEKDTKASQPRPPEHVHLTVGKQGHFFPRVRRQAEWKHGFWNLYGVVFQRVERPYLWGGKASKTPPCAANLVLSREIGPLKCRTLVSLLSVFGLCGATFEQGRVKEGGVVKARSLSALHERACRWAFELKIFLG